jgi:diguanylate cyclase (GGDEF)-like protein
MSPYPSLAPTMALMPAEVFIVEDDPASRLGLCRLLKDCGYRVRTASGGAEALAAIEREIPDVVITDLNISGGNGLKLTSEMRRRRETKDIPIILVSGIDSTDRRVAGLDAGADDFLAKPIEPNELLARVRMHVRHARRRRELMRRSTIDGLTNVLNRDAVLDELHREHKRANRMRSGLAVMLLDVDDFKSINDELGHAVGDAVLSALATALTDSLRASDRVGRLGGDEFLVVLPDTKREQAVALAGRLRKIWSTIDQPPPEVARDVRVSVGVASLRLGDSLEAMMRRADGAMYVDKRANKRADPERSGPLPAVG